MKQQTFLIKSVFRDVSFVSTVKELILVVVFSSLLFVLLGYLGRHAVVYSGSESSQTWKEFLLGNVLGGIDGKPEAKASSVLYVAAVRLMAAILIGGILTSFFCSLVDRLATMRLRGLLVTPLRNHYVVFGYGSVSRNLIKDILVPDQEPGEDIAQWIPGRKDDDAAKGTADRRILLVSCNPIEEVREAVTADFPHALSKRISYAYGGTPNGEVAQDFDFFRSLGISSARQVYIVGDESSGEDHDIDNLALAKRLGAYMAERRETADASDPVPIFVRLDDEASFDFVKKISFVLPDQDPVNTKTFFKPFGFVEGWARRVFGGVETWPPDDSGEKNSPASPLDFATMTGHSRVHLVVIGLSAMGEALVIEAIRVCHYPVGRKTKITIVDSVEENWRAFLARHPGVDSQLVDIDVEFQAESVNSAGVRELLRATALDETALLTVAVCLPSPDQALEVALSLPEELYWHRLPERKKTVRSQYREHGTRILVLQKHTGGIGESARLQERYENLHVFGVVEKGLNLGCIREFPAMYLNATYDWPREADGSLWIDHVESSCNALAERIGQFRSRWHDQLSPENSHGVFEIPASEKYQLLRDILVSDGEKEVRRFQQYAFRKYLSLKPELRWANVYVSDSWGTVFRFLGIRAVRDLSMPVSDRIRANEDCFAERRDAAGNARALYEMEHNRWVADRVLMGYRAPRPGTGEIRDDAFRYHSDIVPFGNLPPDEIGKDELSISCIPIFAALEGFRLDWQPKSGN